MRKIQHSYTNLFIFLTIHILFELRFILTEQIESCVQCNSSIDPKCATNPEIYSYKNCPGTTIECYVRIKDGYTIRGCASELDATTYYNCNNQMKCLKCSSYNGCNQQKFPLHRVTCLQCIGNSTHSLCATDIHNSTLYQQLCPIYKFDDSCYIRKDNKNHTDSFQRGCLSSALAKGLCKNNADCFTCKGNDCNTLLGDAMDIPLARDHTTKLTPFTTYITLIFSYFICILLQRF